MLDNDVWVFMLLSTLPILVTKLNGLKSFAEGGRPIDRMSSSLMLIGVSHTPHFNLTVSIRQVRRQKHHARTCSQLIGVNCSRQRSSKRR